MKICSLILLTAISLPSYSSLMEESQKFIISYPFFSVVATGIVASCVTWKISSFFANRDFELYRQKYRQYKKDHPKNGHASNPSPVIQTANMDLLAQEMSALKYEISLYKQASQSAEDFFKRHIIYFTQASVIATLDTIKTKKPEAYETCIKTIQEAMSHQGNISR